MDQARLYRELLTGAMQESKFLVKYQRNEGFTVKVIGTEKGGLTNDPIHLTLALNDIICNAKEIVFFGAPFEATRPLDPLFQWKANRSSLFHVFKHMAMEYWGDANASSQLYATYCKRKAQSSDTAVSSAGLIAIKELHDELKDMTLSKKVFCCMFNGL